MSSQSLKPSTTVGAFQEVYDNCDLLEYLAVSIIRTKQLNISNGRALEIVNDFINFVEAFPILLKSGRIKGYLSRTKTNDILHDYSKMMRLPFKLSELVKLPSDIELEGSSTYSWYSKSPVKTFYNTQTIYVIYNMFSSFSSDVIKKIIEGFQNFITVLDNIIDQKKFYLCKKLGSINRLKYGKIIRRLLLIESNDRQYEGFLNVIIKMFVIDLRKSLVKINVNGFDSEKIIRRIIKSFDWRLDCNNLDYGR